MSTLRCFLRLARTLPRRRLFSNAVPQAGPGAALAELFAAPASSLIAPNTQALLEGLLRGDRVCLARAITLVESTRQDHRRQAGLLLDEVLRVRQLLASRQMAHLRGVSSGTALGDVVAEPIRGTFRVGIAGPPGAGEWAWDSSRRVAASHPSFTSILLAHVGKSSLIEVLGMHLVGLGHRVAVVAVDPSSSRTGGLAARVAKETGCCTSTPIIAIVQVAAS